MQEMLREARRCFHNLQHVLVRYMTEKFNPCLQASHTLTIIMEDVINISEIPKKLHQLLTL